MIYYVFIIEESCPMQAKKITMTKKVKELTKKGIMRQTVNQPIMMMMTNKIKIQMKSKWL